jgi:ATP-dependent DNA helicase RecQ
VKEDPGVSGIIYCLTRKKVEEVCFQLRKDGFSVTRYHAGLSDEERQENQEDFINDRKQIMVATNAFGMGIDKSDVRFVVHYNMPKNMESYYQEAGRAGRDGESAECILYYEPMDVRTNRFFIENNEDNEELDEITRELVRQRDEERLQQMTFYCFKNTCLRQYILSYFGETSVGYCGNCQNCMTEYEDVDITKEVRAILTCIRENRFSYGITIIMDILRGAKNQKITSRGLEENSQYGVLADVSVPRIRQIIQELLAEGYLEMSGDTYPVLSVGEWGVKLLESGQSMTMKLAREQEPKVEKHRKTKIKAGAAAVLSEDDHALFERLRELRKQIAVEEKVPPYLVFSDKTLAGMSRNKPATLAGMRLVSGVGEYKLEKYGERFLAEIAKYT